MNFCFLKTLLFLCFTLTLSSPSVLRIDLSSDQPLPDLIQIGDVFYSLTGSNSAVISPTLLSSKEKELSSPEGSHNAETEKLDELWSPTFYTHLTCAIACVLLAAMAAGLTMGFISVDPLQLKIILESDLNDFDEEDQQELIQEKLYAARILPLVEKHHLLLVTLLILNSFANEALPLFLDKVVPTWLAVLLAMTAVLLFAEIIPSAIFTGSNQLRIASALSPLVWGAMMLLYPIGKPISLLLDLVLGEEEETRMRRGELKALVKLHIKSQDLVTTPLLASSTSSYGSNSQSSSSQETPKTNRPKLNTVNEDSDSDSESLSLDEVSIIHGALELRKLTVKDIMIPLDVAEMLSTEDVLDMDTMAQLMHAGHSRVPVFHGEREHIVGLLLVKRLIVVSPENKRTVRSLYLRKPLVVPESMGLLDMLNEFQNGHSHLAVVCPNQEAVDEALRRIKKHEQTFTACLTQEDGVSCATHNDTEQSSLEDCAAKDDRPLVVGILTLEDVLECVLKEEIADETSRRRKINFNRRGSRRASVTPHANVNKQPFFGGSQTPTLGARKLNANPQTPYGNLQATTVVPIPQFNNPEQGKNAKRRFKILAQAVRAFKTNHENKESTSEHTSKKLTIPIPSSSPPRSPPLSGRASAASLPTAKTLLRIISSKSIPSLASNNLVAQNHIV